LLVGPSAFFEVEQRIRWDPDRPADVDHLEGAGADEFVDEGPANVEPARPDDPAESSAPQRPPRDVDGGRHAAAAPAT